MNFAFRTWRPSGADVDDSLLALNEEARVAVGLFLLRDLELDEGHDGVESVFPLGFHLLDVRHPLVPTVHRPLASRSLGERNMKRKKT